MLIGDSCQFWKDLEKQTLSSPYYPQSYFANNDICNWLLIAPKGHIISLEFEYFDVSKKLNFNIQCRDNFFYLGCQFRSGPQMKSITNHIYLPLMEGIFDRWRNESHRANFLNVRFIFLLFYKSHHKSRLAISGCGTIL